MADQITFHILMAKLASLQCAIPVMVFVKADPDCGFYFSVTDTWYERIEDLIAAIDIKIYAARDCQLQSS